MTKYTESELLKVKSTISPFIHNTPVHTSNSLDMLTGASCFLKCENFQKTGSFKIRGAAYALSQLSDREKKQGVITHSSGNFAQALSFAALKQGIPATVVMPENAPQAKVDAVRNYKGKIVFSASNSMAREKKVDELKAIGHQTFVHPSDDVNVILGHSSAALELLKQQPDIDTLICPVGGGGLLAGTCLGAKAINGSIYVFGAEPDEANDAYLSLEKGEILLPKTTNTIADGLRTHLGKHNFPIIQEQCKAILCVSEDDITMAQQYIWERMKLVIEPSSAVAVAAVIKNPQMFKDKKVGIIISGGNVNFKG